MPWALATADGVPVKTEKSTLLHFLEGDLHTTKRPSEDKISYIIDGNALLHAQVALSGVLSQMRERNMQCTPRYHQRLCPQGETDGSKSPQKT